MNEQDPILAVLKDLDRPAAPRPEFAAALRAQLLAELAEPNGAPDGRSILGARVRLRRRRPLLVGALAVALVAAIVVVVLLSRPIPASAVDVILQAQRAFASVPPFQATVRMNLNPDGKNPNGFVPRGATETVAISYGGPRRFRAQIVGQHPRFGVRSVAVPGSYVVYDENLSGYYDALRKFFVSNPVTPGAGRPLQFLSWHGAYDWERVCRTAGSKVLPDARVAGREARHVRCGDFKGGFWQLWIDRQTGLLLKIVGQVSGDAVFLGEEVPGSSAKGGFQIEQLRYNPTFPPATFRVTAPNGALDYWGRIQAAYDKVPSFKAVVEQRFHGHTSVDEVWWQKGQSWRTQVLVHGSNDLFLTGGAGSFAVYAHGQLQTYNARDRSDSSVASAWLDHSNPANELLPQGAIYNYSPAACPIVGHDRIAGHDTLHRHCTSPDVWLDAATGLILQEHVPGFDVRVRSIDYNPTFPPGIFQFAAPRGSRSQQNLFNDPYYKTKLAPGKPAPDWQAPKLGGGSFRPSDLRGKPALLLLESDTCPPGEQVCNVFKPIQQTYEKWKNQIGIVWVDLQGTAKEARQLQRYNHLTLPVVVDDSHRNVVIKAWNIQGYPYWLLLDKHGRVIEARFKPQTTTQLDQLLAKAK